MTHHQFRLARNNCKKVLDNAKRHCAESVQESISTQRLGCGDFWRIANSVLNRNKSTIPVLFNGPEVRTSPTDKVNLFADRFASNSTLDDLRRDLPDCPSRVDSILCTINVTPKMVAKVISHLDTYLFTDIITVGAPKDFHWLFHLHVTVPLAAPHVSLLIHILILYQSPKQIPGGTHPVSSHVLPYFGIHYLYLASLLLITCLNSSAISTVNFLLFDFLFFYPLLPYLAFTLSGLYRPCDWQLLIEKN